MRWTTLLAASGTAALVSCAEPGSYEPSSSTEPHGPGGRRQQSLQQGFAGQPSGQQAPSSQTPTQQTAPQRRAQQQQAQQQQDSNRRQERKADKKQKAERRAQKQEDKSNERRAAPPPPQKQQQQQQAKSPPPQQQKQAAARPVQEKRTFQARSNGTHSTESSARSNLTSQRFSQCDASPPQFQNVQCQKGNAKPPSYSCHSTVTCTGTRKGG